MEHPNVGRVREGYAAFGSGDMAKLDESFADDIVWHVSGDHKFSGDYKGKQEVFAHFQRLGEEMQGSLRFDFEEMLGNDHHVMALCHVTAKKSDTMFDGMEVHVFNMTPDGKVAEFSLYPEDSKKVDAFFGK